MNKRRQSFLVAIFLFGVLSIFPSGSTALPGYAGQKERVIALPELESPRQIVVKKGRVYFVDRRDVVAYNLADGRFIRKIGKLGQGPGEFAMGPSRLAVLGDRIIVQNSRRLDCFNLEGVYTGGFNEPDSFAFYPMLPVGRNYVGFALFFNDGSLTAPSGRIYDSHLKLKRKFFGEIPALPPAPLPPGNAEQAGRSDKLLIRDYGDYAVYEDRIYVIDSRRELPISVFDENGDLLREINLPIDKVKVPRSFVDGIVKEWKASKDWKSYYSRINPVVPDFFPALIDFKTDGGRIYALTAAQKNGLYEIIVMDLEGKILEREFRFPLRPNFELPFFNGFSYDIEGNKIVWFAFNNEKETYELHIR